MVAVAPTYAQAASIARLLRVRSASAPTTGSTRTCSATETNTAAVNQAVARIGMPRTCTKPSGSAAFLATSVRYGPRKTDTTVVENVELAQS